jgi:hypothetical protein
LWENAWAEFVPFLAFDVEIRKVICSTTAIESVNARIRKAVRARGHFPNEQAALKCVYLALMSLDPTGAGRRRWTMPWKAPLNAFQIAFEGRLIPTNHRPPQQPRSAVNLTLPSERTACATITGTVIPTSPSTKRDWLLRNGSDVPGCPRGYRLASVESRRARAVRQTV